MPFPSSISRPSLTLDTQGPHYNDAESGGLDQIGPQDPRRFLQQLGSAHGHETVFNSHTADTWSSPQVPERQPATNAIPSCNYWSHGPGSTTNTLRHGHSLRQNSRPRSHTAPSHSRAYHPYPQVYNRRTAVPVFNFPQDVAIGSGQYSGPLQSSSFNEIFSSSATSSEFDLQGLFACIAELTMQQPRQEVSATPGASFDSVMQSITGSGQYGSAIHSMPPLPSADPTLDAVASFLQPAGGESMPQYVRDDIGEADSSEPQAFSASLSADSGITTTSNLFCTSDGGPITPSSDASPKTPVTQPPFGEVGIRQFSPRSPFAASPVIGQGKVAKYSVEQAAIKKRKHEPKFFCARKGCGQTFTALHNWRNHENSHLGKRDHFCQYRGCGARFITRSDARRHERTCHDD